MPGPKAVRPGYKRDAEFTRPNKRSARRLTARVAAFEATVNNRSTTDPEGYRKPGSQNRNK